MRRPRSSWELAQPVRLSHADCDAGVSVTLLEAGGEDANPAIHDPSRMGELWHSPDDWDYYTVPQAGAAGRRLHLPRGKVLGGSHALNAMIWVRGNRSDFDHWASLGNDGWTWDDVLPAYRAIENWSGGASNLRGAGGPMPVTDDYELSPIQQAMIDAAVQEGLERNPDCNGDHLDGVSQQQVTMIDGRRANTWTTYLKPVRDQLDIRTGRHVHSVVVEDGRAVGVRYRADGEDRELRADEVILAAGALDSPAILLRSGIGPQAELAALGIDVVQDSPGVSRNLHDHLLAPVIGTATTREIAPPRQGVPVTQSHLFWRSKPDLEAPDTQPIMFSVPMFGDLEPVIDAGFTFLAGMVTPKSRGALTFTGPDLCGVRRSPTSGEPLRCIPGQMCPTQTSKTMSATPSSPTTTKSAPAGWVWTNSPSWTHDCGCTASKDSVSSTPRSCRASRPGTRTRRACSSERWARASHCRTSAWLSSHRSAAPTARRHPLRPAEKPDCRRLSQPIA